MLSLVARLESGLTEYLGRSTSQANKYTSWGFALQVARQRSDVYLKSTRVAKESGSDPPEMGRDRPCGDISLAAAA